MPVMILNLGKAKKVRLEIEIESVDGQSLCRKVFSDISIPAGRSQVRIEDIVLPKLVDGIYCIRYRIYG